MKNKLEEKSLRFFFLTKSFKVVEQLETILRQIQANKHCTINKVKVIKHQHSNDCKNIISIESFDSIIKEVFLKYILNICSLTGYDLNFKVEVFNTQL